MARPQGTCDVRFEEVKKLFQAFLDSGEELGASIHVNIDGEDVVDLWGGYADKDRTREWSKDTISPVFSTTKCITALAALVLIDRGLLSPYDKVSKYWPEFAANGKQDIEIRHIMSNSSGISGWEAPMTMSDVMDIPRATALLAEQAPFWPPGTAPGYHALTVGHLVGELVRRTTGKTLAQFIAEEIATPLGADYHLGTAEKHWTRIAEAIPPPTGRLWTDVDPNSIPGKTFNNPKIIAEFVNTPEWRRSENGSANGFSNARGVSRIMSTIALGGNPGGVQLLSPKTIDLIFEEQVNSTDLALGAPVRMGIGYALTGKGTMAGWLPDEEGICCWGGWGGSLAIVDVKRRMTIAFVMNRMEDSGLQLGNPRGRAYVGAVYKALGVN